MLLPRVITAIVLLLILWLVIWAGPIAFALAMAIAFGLALYEWLRIGSLGPVPAALVAAVEMIAQFSLYWAGALEKLSWFLWVATGLVTLAWLVILGIELMSRQTGFKVSVPQCLLSAVVFVPAAYLSLLYLYEWGSWVMVLSVLLIVWGADISAYFCGRAFGRTKMCPAISPNKTNEGALGAYVIVIFFFLMTYLLCDQRDIVFTNYVFDHLGFTAGLIIVALFVALSIAGDLWESMLKRLAGIKDSSHLLPGHGGFFDRLDACLPILPASVFILLSTLLLK